MGVYRIHFVKLFMETDTITTSLIMTTAVAEQVNVSMTFRIFFLE